MRVAIIALVVTGLVAMRPSPARSECDIAGLLDDEARKGRYWNAGWGYGLAAAAVGQAIVGATIETCPNCFYISAAKAAIGSVWTFAIDRVKIQATPREDTCTATSIGALRRSAASERIKLFGRFGGYALNLAGVLYLGLAEDEWVRASIGGAVGLLVGEIRLWTRPYGAVRALGKRGAQRDKLTGLWSVMPLVQRHTTGAQLLFTF